MMRCDTLICRARVLDGTGREAEVLDLAISGDRIVEVGPSLRYEAEQLVEADGLTLAPGFIDVHTHDDTSVVEQPEMLAKISQGVTTVIVGNCGISAAPVVLRGEMPDPMHLLGEERLFRYPTFAKYAAAVGRARPAVNVGALVGHTSLRQNHMDRLDREARPEEIAAMRGELEESLAAGALGLSTGLAYLSAIAASTEEVVQLAEPLARAGAIYTTHLRSETEDVLAAMDEAFAIGRRSEAPVVVSHMKCAGVANWGRSQELLDALDRARTRQPAGGDCYPYAAGSSTLDLRQVDERVLITITWSHRCPEMAGRALSEIAKEWGVSQQEAARRLQPAGAIYHSLSEEDMQRILVHPATMIGSDGLPHDPRPHPRLWGTFARVLGRYCREQRLMGVAEAVRKMTQLPGQRFGLEGRGVIREGFFADLVLFDAETILDQASYAEPVRACKGVHGVWVNGVLSYTARGATGERGGRFLPRGRVNWSESRRDLQARSEG